MLSISILEDLSTQLCEEDRLLQHTLNLESRITVSVSPTSFEDTRRWKMKGLPRRTKDVIALIYFLPFLSDLLQSEIRLYLEQELESRNRPAEQRARITSFYRDRTLLITWLRQQNARYVFGHFKRDIVRTIMNIRFVAERPPSPKFQQRKRGYTDHGTLLPETKWQEKFDWSFTKDQLEIERTDALTDICANTDWYCSPAWIDSPSWVTPSPTHDDIVKVLKELAEE